MKATEKISAALKVPKIAASIILKWKKLETTRTLPGSDLPERTELSGEKDLCNSGDGEPDGHSR